FNSGTKQWTSIEGTEHSTGGSCRACFITPYAFLIHCKNQLVIGEDDALKAKYVAAVEAMKAEEARRLKAQLKEKYIGQLIQMGIPADDVKSLSHNALSVCSSLATEVRSLKDQQKK
ncbi:hypothetical protein KIPB_016950, partial [Kipferlia bialata]